MEEEREKKVNSLYDTKEKALEFLAWERDHDYYVYRCKYGYRKARIAAYPIDVPAEFMEDREFVLAAIKLNGNMIIRAPDKYKYDRELLRIAAETSDVRLWWFEKNFDPKIFEDKEFYLEILAINGLFYIFTKSEDMDIILTAVKQNYEAAIYVPYDITHDRESAMKLVAAHGRSLQYLPDELRDDEEIVFTAAASYRSFEFASNRLKSDEAFLMRVLEKNPSCVAYAPVKYREDKALMTRLMQAHPYVYRYLKGDLTTNVGLALYALGRDARLCEFVPYVMQKNKGFVAAVKRLIDGGTLDGESAEILRGAVEQWNRR